MAYTTDDVTDILTNTRKDVQAEVEAGNILVVTEYTDEDLGVITIQAVINTLREITKVSPAVAGLFISGIAKHTVLGLVNAGFIKPVED